MSLIEGFSKPPGRFAAKQKCRDLTLLRSSLLAGISVPPLCAEDVAVFTSQGGDGHARLVTPQGGGQGSDTGSGHSPHSERSSPADDRMASMEASLAQCMDTIAIQN